MKKLKTNDMKKNVKLAASFGYNALTAYQMKRIKGGGGSGSKPDHDPNSVGDGKPNTPGKPK